MEDFQHSRNSSPRSTCTIIAEQLLATNRIMENILYNDIFDPSLINPSDSHNDISIKPNVSANIQHTTNKELERTQGKSSKETSFIRTETPSKNVEQNISSRKRNGQIETV